MVQQQQQQPKSNNKERAKRMRRLFAIAGVLLLYSNSLYVILIANPLAESSSSSIHAAQQRQATVYSLETAIPFESLQRGIKSLVTYSENNNNIPASLKNASVSVKLENLSAEQAIGLWEHIKQATDLFRSATANHDNNDNNNNYDDDAILLSPPGGGNGGVASSVVTRTTKRKGKYLRYNICNGLSNQLLIHAAYIARAKQEDQIVQIPDYFIMNGVQTSDANVIPNANNSVPFGYAFDRALFRTKLEEMGVDATFVTFNFSKPEPEQIKCAGVGMVQHADPLVVKQVLEAFKPSRRLQNVISRVQRNFRQQQRGGINDGVCVHHRDGQDWHDHCHRWSKIPDGVYRGNCLGVPNRTFVESLEDRGLDKSKWVYYCGDHGVPPELREAGYKVISRSNILGEQTMTNLYKLPPGTETRDLWALVDFFACRNTPLFIGNSVSTFSAIQIALKDGKGAYWYNSQSIPLSHAWRVYQIPIVYTYTEMSAKAGQHFLKASIASVQRQMPHNKIHVLYHGTKDESFRKWLTDHGVKIHNHFPKWRKKIEEMRRNGDPRTSHLFLHPGNYLGTWQRIDIPLFLDTEYVLLLDSDTIINNPFTLADFGLNMTYGIAMSSEMHMESTVPSNAGVTLMNVPLLRKTHDSFLKFILDHADTADFGHSSPSDQGAYLVFYRNETSFLQRSFNMKPYWPATRMEFKKSFVVHFHGPKPHEYLQFIMGKSCNKALGDLCLLATKRPILCHALREFAVASSEVGGLSNYCHTSFSNDTRQSICENFLDDLVSETVECLPMRRVTLDDLERGVR